MGLYGVDAFTVGLKEFGLLGDMSFSVGLIDTVGERGGSAGGCRSSVPHADRQDAAVSATPTDAAIFPVNVTRGTIAQSSLT